MDQMGRYILDLADNEEKIASYRDAFPKALSLACSRQPHYNSKNMEVTMRLSILFRNR